LNLIDSEKNFRMRSVQALVNAPKEQHHSSATGGLALVISLVQNNALPAHLFPLRLVRRFDCLSLFAQKPVAT
jgi:hypothetical protein